MERTHQGSFHKCRNNCSTKWPSTRLTRQLLVTPRALFKLRTRKTFFCLFVFVIFGNCTGRIALVCIIVEAEDLFLIRRPTLLLTKRRTSEWRWRYDALRRQPRQHNRKCTMWKWQNFECFMDDCDWRKIGRERGSVPLIYIYKKMIYIYIYIYRKRK